MSSKNLKELSDLYQAEIPKNFEWKAHLFPKYTAPVVILRDGKTQIVPMNFGLIPSFELNEKPKMVFHNARSETLKEKASFKMAYQKQRCLIPLDSFFEYIDAKPKKQLIGFFPKNHTPLTAAGIWSLWRNPVSGVVSANFAMITREPPEFILKTGHDRCPLFLKGASLNDWLNPSLNSYDALDQFLLNNHAEYDWAVSTETIRKSID